MNETGWGIQAIEPTLARFVLNPIIPIVDRRYVCQKTGLQKQEVPAQIANGK